MTLKPVSNHIILKAKAAESVTASGIIIPDTVDKDRPEQAEVVAVGPGKMLENGQRTPMEVEVGQTVLFKKYTPDEVELEGETYLIVRAEDVIAIIQ
jgi:chaperonin GroES